MSAATSSLAQAELRESTVRAAADIRSIIDSGPMRSTQLVVIALCFVLNMFDGMDVLAISFAAPVLASSWSIPPETLGLVFSAALVGMTLGALVLAPLADIFGRRSVIMTALAIIAVGMLTTAFTQSVFQISVMRFVTGLGVGALLASLATMTAEYSPTRHRNLAVTFVQAGYPVGGILSGLLANWLIPNFGWQSMFIAGGIITALALPVVAVFMPESLDFLAKKQPPRALERLNGVLKRMGHAPLKRLPESIDEPHGAARIGALLVAERRIPTVLLWLAFFITFGTLYFFLLWIPRLASAAGLPLDLAILASVVFNVGSVIGMVVLGYLSDRHGLKRLIIIWLLTATALMVAFGFLRDPPTIMVVLALLGFTVQGGFIGLYPMAARMYPTLVRSTGVGWAIGIGRIGAIVAPVVAGVLMAQGVSMAGSFIIFAVPLLFAAAAVACIRADQIK